MIALLGLVWGLSGCGSEATGSGEPTLRGTAQTTACGTGPRQWTAQSVSDEAGVLRVPIELAEGEMGFAVGADGMHDEVAVQALGVIDPAGALVWGADTLDWAELPWMQEPLRLRYGLRSGAGVDLGWPQLPGETASPGTWELLVVTVAPATRLPLGNEPVAVVVSVGAPDDGDRCLPVVLGRSSGSAEWDDALEVALDESAEQWAAWGVRFDIEVLDAEPPSADDQWATGDNVALAELAARAPGRVPILALAKETEEHPWLAVTSASPGQLREDMSEGLRVDLGAFADEDGVLDDDAVAHLARVLTHEWAHWLGLVHTHQPESTGPGAPIHVFDAFEDTPDCDGSRAGCLDAAADNLMWPYEDLEGPVLESSLSEQQLAAALQATAAY